MKCSVLLIFLALFVFMAAAEEESIHDMYVGLSILFKIQVDEVQTCMQKFEATTDDLIKFGEVAFKGRENTAQLDSLKRSTCALTCCAQTQGTMNGAKINLPKIRWLINQEDMPTIAKKMYVEAVNKCGEQVKNIANECESGFEFVKCVVKKSKEYNEYE